MKRVSFEIAKALKEVGYPQPQTDAWGHINRPNNCYFTGKHSYYDEYRERRLDWDETNEFHITDDWADEIEPSFYGSAIAAPTYMEVWLWLFNEKNIIIEPKCCINDNGEYYWENGWIDCTYYDPEEAIIAAIEHLINNDLIKM